MEQLEKFTNFDPESDHARIASALFVVYLVSRVALQPRVHHSLHLGFLLQKLGNFQGIAIVTLHSQVQSLQTPV